MGSGVQGEGSEAPHGPGIVPREYIQYLAVAKANYNARVAWNRPAKGQHVWALPFEVGHGWVEVIAAATVLVALYRRGGSSGKDETGQGAVTTCRTFECSKA